MNFLDKLTKILPLPKKSSHEEYYFALNIGADKVEGAVWGMIGNKLHILSAANASYNSEEELTEAANKALDEALADFQPEPNKVLFGVPDSWLQDDDLKPDKLKLLRHLVKELDIAPLAYVSTNQAIAHFINKLQGVPLTAILVRVSDPLNITVIKAGKVIGSKEQKRTANLPDDIEKGLMSLPDIEVLPSKFLVYGSEKDDSSKFKDELQSFSWMANLPFLHLPKIEILTDDVGLQACCMAGALELNPHVSYNPHEKIEHLAENPHHPARVLPRHPDDEINIDSSPSNLRKPLKDDEAIAPAYDLDQVEDEHRSLMLHEKRQEKSHHETTSYSVTLSPIEQIKSMILAPFGLVKSPHEERRSDKAGSLVSGLGRLLLIPGVILILLIGAYLFLPKAKVTVFIDMRVLEKDSQVIADPNATSVDENSKTIPGKVVQTRQQGSTKETATGKKKVGEQSKGKVLVFNKTNSPKSLASGTVLTGPDNLKFTLDSSVQIASQSATTGADFSTIIKPGKSDAISATAKEIGAEGNIAAGAELQVQGFGTDQVVAKVDSAFSGGISKDVTVVTSDDQKRLLAKLTSELRKKAKEEVEAGLTDGFKILEEGLSEEIVKKTYSKNVGDQASEFSLNLSVNYKGTSYNENDLKSMVAKLVETNVPEGYQLDLSKTETQADVSKLEKDGRIIFLAKFRAKLMPKIDKNQLKKNLTFKTPQEAEEQLKKIENVIGANIELSPPIPLKLLQRLPFMDQNINLEITAK